jgi:hypothetical protein
VILIYTLCSLKRLMELQFPIVASSSVIKEILA